jgi:hypothetical protein
MRNALKPSQYFALVMIGIFILLALVCFFSKSIEQDYLKSPRNYVMGTVLILYAAVRYLRVRTDIQKSKTQ